MAAKKKAHTTFKVWLEVEECDEDGDPVNEDDDLSFILPFASSANCETLQDALNTAVDMHNAVNPQQQVDYVIATPQE